MPSRATNSENGTSNPRRHRASTRFLLASSLVMSAVAIVPSSATADDDMLHSTPLPVMIDQLPQYTGSSSLVTFLQNDPVNRQTASLGADLSTETLEPSPLPEKPEGDRLGGQSIFGGDAARSPAVQEGRFSLPPLMAATTQTGEIGNGRTPDGFRGEDSPPLQALAESGFQRGIDWDWSVRTWEAPNTFSHPRYFEDRMLERHGHERFPYLQPIASGTRFFTQVAILPYLMAVSPPFECEYTIGYYRTGSCVPKLKQRPPYERRAVIAQAASAAKTALILP